MADIFFIAAGLVALALGGEALVRGAVALAGRAGVSPMVIGLTLVGFGTSTPELVTSLQAALAGSPGIALGNVVGSNIGNVLLILGLTAALCPVAVDPRALRRDGSVLMAASLAFAAVVVTGSASRATGALFLAALAVYLVVTLRQERRHATAAASVYAGEAAVVAPVGLGAGLSLALAFAGLGLTLVGAHLLVAGAVALAAAAGVSETVIGLTIVAIGTSMPELVASLAAIRAGRTDVALGNVIGSNLFNILGIVGITALIRPLAVPAELVRFDIWVMLAATAALIWVAATGRRVGRLEGAALLAGYGVYLAVLVA